MRWPAFCRIVERYVLLPADAEVLSEIRSIVSGQIREAQNCPPAKL